MHSIPEDRAAPAVSEFALLRSRLRNHDCGRVLDLGCGDGRFLRLLASACRRYSRITAVDPDKDAVDEGRRAALPRGVRFVQAAGELLPFSDSVFETVALADALHHVRDPLRVLRELRRVVAPGGLVIVSEVLRVAESHAEATAVRLHHFKARVDARTGIRHRRTVSPAELQQLVSAVFADDEVRVYRGSPPAAPAAEQGRYAHARRLRRYLRALRHDPRYPILRAVAETLAGRVALTGYTPAPRGVIFVRKRPQRFYSR